MDRFERLKKENDRGGGGIGGGFEFEGGDDDGTVGLDFVRLREDGFVFEVEREGVGESDAGAGAKAVDKNSSLSARGSREGCVVAGVDIGATTFRFRLRVRFSFAVGILKTL